MNVLKILTDAITTATGDTQRHGAEFRPQRTYHASVVGTGAVSATVLIEVSNNAVAADWLTLATITLSGTTTDADGAAVEAPWLYQRARVSAISGTNATVNVWMGS